MEYKCLECKKQYASYKSLWNHNAKFHKIVCKENVKKRQNDVKKMSIKKMDIIETSNYNCINCKKNFKSRQGKWIHEKTCNNEKENKIDIVMKENMEIKAEMEKLKTLLQKALKIHPKTLKKINNELNNNNINSNNTTNNTINNNLYVQLGREDLVNVLTGSEKRAILNRKAMGINDLVELIHGSGKYKQFMNVYITNLQNTVAYCYNEKLNNFIAVNKNELLNDIIDCRMYDIQKFFDEAENYLNPKTSADIKRIIKKMDDDETFKGIKKEEIKFILYNNKDKILAEKNKSISDNEVKSMVENNIEL